MKMYIDSSLYSRTQVHSGTKFCTIFVQHHVNVQRASYNLKLRLDIMQVK
jgi:hypothetical protein